MLCLRCTCRHNLDIPGRQILCPIGAKFSSPASTQNPLSPPSSWTDQTPSLFQSWVGLSSTNKCVCVCLRSPLNLSRSAPTAPGLPASRDPAWVLIPGWVSLWWVMLCNLVPCSVWGLRVIRTTQHTAATTYLSVCESV